MIEHVSVNPSQNLSSNTVSRKERDMKPALLADSDVDVQVIFGDLIGQALNASETDARAVERAQALIAAGQLGTPEAIREAATQMLDGGL